MKVESVSPISIFIVFPLYLVRNPGAIVRHPLLASSRGTSVFLLGWRGGLREEGAGDRGRQVRATRGGLSIAPAHPGTYTLPKASGPSHLFLR